MFVVSESSDSLCDKTVQHYVHSFSVCWTRILSVTTVLSAENRVAVCILFSHHLSEQHLPSRKTQSEKKRRGEGKDPYSSPSELSLSRTAMILFFIDSLSIFDLASSLQVSEKEYKRSLLQALHSSTKAIEVFQSGEQTHKKAQIGTLSVLVLRSLASCEGKLGVSTSCIM